MKKDFINNEVKRIAKQFVDCIDENDFNQIHKVTETVYGFVDSPPLLPTILTTIDSLTKTNTKKKYTVDKLIKKISANRQLELETSRLLDSTIMKALPPKNEPQFEIK